jgi:hypothetical protein
MKYKMNVACPRDEARLFIHSKVANANALLRDERPQMRAALAGDTGEGSKQMWHN